jgi:protocatechuate 3,4-dioxygenase beta subunit
MSMARCTVYSSLDIILKFTVENLRHMKYNTCFYLISGLLLVACASTTQDTQDGTQLLGTCEGCEAVFEYGDKVLGSIDTLSDFDQEGTPIRITGFIYKSDARTPARDVVLYLYHTDQNGVYPPADDGTEWGRRHGSIRGWIKTGADGRYMFYTQKPGTYPDGSEAAHVHATILEPDGRYYWIEEFYFAGDTLLTSKEASPVKPRGGTPGLVILLDKGGILTAQRDIILGRNVPGYE